MASTSLLVRRDGGVITATINRQEKLNALSKDIFDDLKGLVDVLETDKTARVLILTGAGDKAFCVGADLKERQSMNEKDVLVRLEFVRQLYLRLEHLPLPVIAAINGTALGGGLELALTCDLRVAAEQATLGLPEVDLAIIPGNGGTQRLSRLVGMGKALEWVLLARRITASEALREGLLNAVVPEGQALTQALTWATKISESGPIAVRQAKAAIRLGGDRRLEEGLTFEVDCYKPCLYSKDRLEGLKAFAEKRKPSYRGE
jgi:methylglutaconyl-CoA hydratase